MPTNQNPSFCLHHWNPCKFVSQGNQSVHFNKGKMKLLRQLFHFLLVRVNWFPWETFWHDFSGKDRTLDSDWLAQKMSTIKKCRLRYKALTCQMGWARGVYIECTGHYLFLHLLMHLLCKQFNISFFSWCKKTVVTWNAFLWMSSFFISKISPEFSSNFPKWLSLLCNVHCTLTCVLGRWVKLVYILCTLQCACHQCQWDLVPSSTYSSESDHDSGYLW